MARFTQQLMHAWNMFANPQAKDLNTPPGGEGTGSGYGYGGHRVHSFSSVPNQRSIVNAIYVRLSIDASSIGFRHIRKDNQGRYKDDIDSGLNNCLTVEANLDQTSRDFVRDVVLTMCAKGYLAIVPIETDISPQAETGNFDIRSMRVGEIINWYPRHVRVRVWNDDPKRGRYEEIVVSKKIAAVVPNPLYQIMNAPNSTLQRLMRKLQLLDIVDERVASSRLDLIFQLPYEVRSETQRSYAQQRKTEIEMQLTDSAHGIAWTGATEKVIQLNRPVENQLLAQVESLITMVHSQLGITKGVMDGTATEAEVINYYNRTVEPILAEVAQAMHRTFLTKTARSQGQAIDFFRDPFKLVPIGVLAEIVDKFTRNEVLTANEIRGIIGWRPSSDPKADELRNSNLTRAQTGHELSDQAAIPDGVGPSNSNQEGETPK